MTPVITIKYQDRPIRVVGLPDTPFFLLEDMHVLIPCTKKRFIRDLELFSTEHGDALNLAGVYMLIATGLNNFGESTYLRSIERFFVEQVEPALRKYGYPSQTGFEEVDSN